MQDNNSLTHNKFMAAYETDLSFLVDEWYLPSADLEAIFHSMNFTIVTKENFH